MLSPKSVPDPTRPDQSSPLFVLKTSQSPTAGVSDWTISNSPSFMDLEAKRDTSNRGQGFKGKALFVMFKSPSTGLHVKWAAELRNNAGYVRQMIEITTVDESQVVTDVQLLCDITMDAPVQVGRYEQGSPVTSKNTFFGMEVPFFSNMLSGNTIESGFSCNFQLKKDVSYTFSSVIGVFPDAQFRRSLLHYIERERARSYQPFLHYNCWYDLERNVSEKGMLDRINFIHRELGEKRGVQVVSYVVDDGYDDYNSGFWTFNTNKFPNGFTPLSKRLAEVNSHLGVWLSPAGGYLGEHQRREQAKKIGITSLDLSGSVYHKWFLDRHVRFIKEDEVNYFKWDKLGGGVSGHFMALMNIAQELRALNPELFLNTTVGTWQSPFWLNHVDCTWRGGGDMGSMGKGCNREKWLTYRDAISYNAIAKSDFAYPLNALMNHGIVYSDGLPFSRTALAGSKDLRNEVRSYFGGGYALQELYINPHILEEKHWDAIAQGALWAKKRAAILVDSHFIGGNPNALQVYGFAAWQNNHGTITLRNPNDIPQIYSLNISSAFELPEGACQEYLLKSPYPDQRLMQLDVTAKTPVTIDLKPFEVLVFDAHPK